ncbi:MAG: group II intron reverse transcriptase domain-containing protein [Alphaproteobacteria bacterium]|nr:group II intron reverse transcriptase domain-containing protein [Alphaproteobacteria bacterium]
MEQQLELFDFNAPIALEDLFEAYFECRKHKRKTLNALSFEVDYEHNLIELWQQINNGTYKIGRSIAFIVEKPVKREIFAADFRDRVVHHLVIRKLEQYFEKVFSPNSCSCRKGKGTLYAVKRVADYIQKRAKQANGECYVLKMDIQAFFMSIDCNLLCRKLLEFVEQYYMKSDKNLVKKLVEMIVLNRPQYSCIRRGKYSSWDGLPRHKSLFYAADMNGMPIGNLTSQIFANFYLNDLDGYVDSLPQVDYVRYVDDFVLIGNSKDTLKKLIAKIRELLKQKLSLVLHPKKIYLQHYQKGVNFVGVRLKGALILAGNRLKRNFFEKITEMNLKKGKVTSKRAEDTRAFFNSYCGYMIHLNAYNLRMRGWRLLKNELQNCFLYVKNCAYVVMKG